jgi:acyl-CoA reductase-like NAD-dependent aldehyde dehydrogenase
LLLALPALAAGNAVVLKPSEVVPKTGAIVAAALQKHLPPGVLELVQGDGSVGAALVTGAIDMVAMTGSTAVGRIIMAACAKDLKRLVLELGGKDPMVVFADADVDLAAADAVRFSMWNCGQVCCSVERVYVAAAIKDVFEAKCVELARALQVGDGMDPTTTVGPMVSAMQRQLVSQQVKDATKNGAKMLYQSQVPAGEGNWYPATVLADVGQDLFISQTETFGPVLSITPFDGSEVEAVRLSNDTPYGLAAYVYTQDLDKAARVSVGIKAGQVGVNNYAPFNASAACPWVGHKGSGFGYHSGADGWRQFSVPKSIVFNSEEEVGASLKPTAAENAPSSTRSASVSGLQIVAVSALSLALGFALARRNR